MSTLTTQNATPDLAVGQSVITTEGNLSTVLSIDGPTARLVNGSIINTDTAHVVPEPAARVQFHLNDNWHTGIWLDCVPANGRFKIEWIRTDGELESRLVEATVVPNACTTVLEDPDPVVATLALLRRTEVQAHCATVQGHRERMASLVERAHEEADAREWCEEFDDLMDELGLPRRSRDYEVEVEATVSLYLSVSGTSEDDAAASIDVDDVREAIADHRGNITFNIP